MNSLRHKEIGNIFKKKYMQKSNFYNSRLISFYQTLPTCKSLSSHPGYQIGCPGITALCTSSAYFT